MTTPLTLTTPAVTLTGLLTGYGPIGTYRIGVTPETIDAAVFGPKKTHFTIDNIGTINSPGTTALDAGIALGAAGTITNAGYIYAGTGIMLLGKSGHGTITNTGQIHGYEGDGIYAQNAAKIINAGHIAGDQAGLSLAAGGLVKNQAGGLIGGRENFGLVANKPATIVNTGEIYGLNGFGAVRLNAGGTLINHADLEQFLQTTGYAAAGFYQAGTLINTGSMYGGTGVKFQLSSTSTAAIYIHNLSRITAYNFTDVSAPSNAGFLSYGLGIYANAAALAVNAGFISGNHAGILFQNAPGTVQNTGYIIAGLGYGVDLAAGGTITNAGTIDGYFIGIDTSGPATITNTGLIQSTKPGFSAPVTDRADAAILAAGPATVATSGTIDSGNIGIYLEATGTVRNTGQITAGLEAIYVKGPAGYAYNAGQITAQIGMSLGDGGTLNNQSTIDATLNGLFLYKPGSFLNAGIIEATGTYIGAAGIVMQQGGQGENSGRITGAFGVISNGFASITNTGTITSTGTGGLYAGILFNIGGGYLRNSGAIFGANVGILAESGATIKNLGTITGATYAIYFAPGYANRLIITPHSTITGAVNGGGGILELAAGNPGTFTAADQTQFADFATLQIDPAAIWDFAGNLTLAAATPLRNNGTIKESPTDTITIDSPLTGTGVIDLSKSPLTLNNTVAAGQKISFTGTTEILALGAPKTFRAKIENFKLGDTIDLTAISLSAITATHFAAGILTIDESTTKLEFTFTNPSTFGTETFALTAAGPGTAITLAPEAAALLPVTPTPTLTPLPTLAN